MNWDVKIVCRVVCLFVCLFVAAQPNIDFQWLVSHYFKTRYLLLIFLRLLQTLSRLFPHIEVWQEAKEAAGAQNTAVLLPQQQQTIIFRMSHLLQLIKNKKTNVIW